MKYKILVTQELDNLRLDKVIIQSLEDISRSALKKQLDSVTINGIPHKLAHICKNGDMIEIQLHLPDLPEVKGEDIPLDILYEDDNYIIINKPCGMVVHPAKGNYSGTLVNALIGMNRPLSDMQDIFRPGIVHRLDKETSGIIVVARNNQAHAWLGSLFQERKVEKEYHAWVKGFVTPANFICHGNIGRHQSHRKKMAVLEHGGKTAETEFDVQGHFSNYTYLIARPKTGRTHQIRVHLANAGYPIVGDPIYARRDSRFPDQSLCLAAASIKFYDKYSDKNIFIHIDDPPHMQQFRLCLKQQ